MREFEECRTVHQFEQTWRFEDFTASEDSQDLDKIKELFEKWNQWDSKVSKHIQPQIFRGLIKADGKKLKDTLTLKVKKELASLRLHLFEIAENLNKGINKNLEKISEDVKKDMKNLDSYVGFVRCLKEADETIRECESQKGRLEQMKVLLQKNRVKDENAGTLSGSQTYVQKLQVKIEQITNIIEQLQNELAKANDKAGMSREGNLAQLEQEIEKQKTQIRDQIDRLDSEILTKPDVKPELALQELAKIKRSYDGLNKKVEQYQENENVLNVENRVEIPEMEIFEQRYEKRFNLWNNREKFENLSAKWYDAIFLEQDAEAIVKQVKQYDQDNIQAKMKLKKGEIDEVLNKFDMDVRRVVEHCPLIEALGCKDLESRHWQKIFKQMDNISNGMDQTTLTLNRMIDDEAMNHLEFIQEVSGMAKGEADLSR